ncbi:MAG: hypothetical protein ACOVK2_04900 [Candidatus Fonsibacter sp.]
MTAVKWLFENLNIYVLSEDMKAEIKIFEQAKEMEKKEKLKHQLFIGKVSEIIGYEKTIELLKEVNKEIK